MPSTTTDNSGQRPRTALNRAVVVTTGRRVAQAEGLSAVKLRGVA